MEMTWEGDNEHDIDVAAFFKLCIQFNTSRTTSNIKGMFVPANSIFQFIQSGNEYRGNDYQKKDGSLSASSQR